MRSNSEQELRDELVRLRIAVVRRLRERLEDPDEPATPSYLEAARKLLTDQGMTLDREPPPRATPLTVDLPFGDPDE